MNLSLNRGGSDSSRSDIKAPPVPQVNLLPADIANAKEADKIKRWLGLALLLAIVVIGGIYFLTTQNEADARDRLETERAETTSLTRERNRLSYVPPIYAFRDTLEQGVRSAMFAEVLFHPYIQAFTAVLPEDASFTSITYELATTNVSGTSDDSLLPPYAAEIRFVTRSASLPDTAEWMRRLNGLYGISSASLETSQIAEDEGAIFYETVVSVYANLDALSMRFEGTPEDADESSEEDSTEEQEG